MLSLLTGLALASALPRSSPPAVLEAEVDGRRVALPSLKTDVDARIDGDLATVVLTQTFANETGRPIDARYVFPLPTGAAVHDMVLTTASSTTHAEIRRRDEAKRVYEQAKAEGKHAALLDQERPNVFTQQVSNLAPGEQVKVTLTWAEAVRREDGAFGWTLPLVVGPRYLPATEAPPLLPTGEWTVQAADAVAPPAEIDGDRVAVTVHLRPGFPITGLDSPSHPVDVAPEGDGWVVTLRSGRTLDNADLVLSWRAAAAQATVSASAWADAGHGVVSLLVDPPATAAPDAITPRELVFVLDTSCSMSGFPLDTSKRLMKQALTGLRPTDRFRVVRFSSSASEFEDAPAPGDPETVQRALAWVDALQADGGTEVGRGLDRALLPAVEPGRMRLVVLLTDGYIGHEAEIVGQVERERGEARIFALGIGSSVNRFLVEQVARSGRGVARVVLGPDDAEEAADALAERLAAPYLTDVTIDWGDAPVRDVTPAVLPDLFLGEPLRVMARFDRPGRYPVVVSGRVNGRPASLPLTVDLPEQAPGAEALPVVWARSEVEDRMVAWMDPAIAADRRSALQEEVTTLGLEYGLETQWTSFVAVADDPARPAIDVPELPVPTPSPAGTSLPGATFGGGATPEPAPWMAGLLLLGLRWLTRGRRTAR